jgi:hypothetical protein
MSMEITKMKWRGYTITFSTSHIIIHSPEGWLRYELPKSRNTTQDALNTINKDIEITEAFHPTTA